MGNVSLKTSGGGDGGKVRGFSITGNHVEYAASALSGKYLEMSGFYKIA